MIRMETQSPLQSEAAPSGPLRIPSIADGDAFSAAVGAADEACRRDDDSMNAGILFDQLDLVALCLEACFPALGFGSRFQLRRAVAAAHIGKIGGDLGIELPIENADQGL